jgi:FKBP-type peptidyl-prolyl cis-trans isomerase 2
MPLEPGMRVRHPAHPEWGEGQVQSVIEERVTVNFEHLGKVLINTLHVVLEILD